MMSENQNQPKQYDAVQGGQSQVPLDAAVLGGIQGVKSRLAIPVVEVQISALEDALKYGEAGLNLVIQALQNETRALRHSAYLLLQQRTEQTVKQALRLYYPYPFFECLYTLSRNLGEIYSVAISLDGHTLVSGSSDNTVRVWDVSTGELVYSLKQHRQKVLSVAISPDAKTLVSSSHDNTIIVWNLKNGEAIRTLKGHSWGVCSVAVSPDGETIVSGSLDGTIRLWNLQTVRENLALHPVKFYRTFYEGHRFIWLVAISSDGKNLVTGNSDMAIQLWDLQSGQRIRTLGYGHHSQGWSIALSRDGQIVASGTLDKTIKLWNLQTGKLIRTINGDATSVAISPDGKTLLGNSFDKTIKVWDLTTGEEICALRGHSNYIRSIVLSSDGQKLISTDSDYKIKVWGIP